MPAISWPRTALLTSKPVALRTTLLALQVFAPPPPYSTNATAARQISEITMVHIAILAIFSHFDPLKFRKSPMARQIENVLSLVP